MFISLKTILIFGIDIGTLVFIGRKSV